MEGYTAADVKKLREETDAPILEVKNALVEANGDYEKAKTILREKGRVATAKRADRATGAGVVAFAVSANKKTLGAVVLESETDFVSKNESFIATAQEIAQIYLDHQPGENPTEASNGKTTVQEIIEEAVGKIRENIRVAKAVHIETDGEIEFYLHHDRTKGAIVVIEGNSSEHLRKVAIQIVASPPMVLSKDQLSQEALEKEIETEIARAINEGKDEKIAKNVATGRVNKEFVKRVALLEQPFYLDPSLSVGQFIAQSGGGSKVSDFVYLAVGAH